MKKQKLELIWIGKENRSKLEPRICFGDPEKRSHAKHRVTKSDIFSNRLVLNIVGATNLHKDAMPYVDLTKGRYSKNGRASTLLPCWPSANGVISRIFLVPVGWWPKCECYMKAVQ